LKKLLTVIPFLATIVITITITEEIIILTPQTVKKIKNVTIVRRRATLPRIVGPENDNRTKSIIIPITITTISQEVDHMEMVEIINNL
jgi:hypothetical protein